MLICSGEGTRAVIPYGRQDITEADISAVKEVLQSDFLTQGPAVPRFEQALADYCETDFGVAVNSATSALHIACLALEVGPGDSVWTSPNTFVASANCALYCGADVDFVDIDADTYNISVDALADKLESAEKQGNLPKVVIPVHFAGRPCDMPAISELAKRYGFRVIEDASHAVGGDIGETKVGACAYSDITVFSFHPVKIITSGEGGLATTSDASLAERMRLFRSHCVTRDQAYMTHEPDGDWYYQQIDLGFNYRMTDLQAALGLSQFQRLDQYVDRRHEIARRYDDLLRDLPLKCPAPEHETRSALHLYPVQVSDAETRSAVFRHLRGSGIGANVHYIPVHTQPYYQNLGFGYGDFPNAESYYQRAISLPLFPLLTDAQQDRVVEELERALSDSN